MQQYVKDISLKRSIIKICIIIYFLLPIWDELANYRGFDRTLPVIPIVAPLISNLVVPTTISNFFSLNWLSYFLYDTPLSLPDIVSSLIVDGRLWLGGFFYPIIYRELTPNLIYFLFFEALIFASGLILFIVSIIHSSRKKVSDQKIVTTGIYKYVRHPQNLALIIMALPFALYIPFFYDFGIYFGDLLCWIQLIILLTLYSDYTDYKLKEKYPEDFLSYYQQTGFFLPKVYSIKKLQFLSVFNRPIIRYLCLALIYLLVVLFFFLIYLNSGPKLRIY